MQVRSYHESPPLIPGSRMRFEWLPETDPDVERVRGGVQDGGPGMYVFRTPDGRKAVVEAYYPTDGIQPQYFKNGLDRFRRADYQNGNLIVVAVWRILSRELTGRDIAEIRRNNRQHNPDLRRHSHSADRKLAIQDAQERDEMNDPEVRAYLDAYVDAALETRKMMKPRNLSTRRIV